MNYFKNNKYMVNTFNINDLPYIKDRTFNEIKLKYYELYCLSYDASIDISQMLLRIDYVLDYIMKNYPNLGKKEIKERLKEIEFYTKKPLDNVTKLNRMVASSWK